MSERYTRLFSLPENLYTEGAPVLIAAGALLKDNQTGKVLAQLKFKNIGFKKIKAITVKLTLFDTVGRHLGNPISYQYLDLSAIRDDEFGQKTPITVPDISARSFGVIAEEIAFEDNSVWSDTGSAWESLGAPKEFSAEQDAELVKQYRMEYGKYLLTEKKDLWFCPCGALNHQDETECHSCNNKKKMPDWIQLKENRNARIVKEREQAAAAKARAAAEREQREKDIAEKQKKVKKFSVISCGILLIVLLCVGAVKLTTDVLVPNRMYTTALSLMDNEQYEEAIDAFSTLLEQFKEGNALTKVKTARQIHEHILNCENAITYKKAFDLLGEEKYYEALREFRSIINYSDSKVLAKQCENLYLDELYSPVFVLISEGSYTKALENLIDNIGYDFYQYRYKQIILEVVEELLRIKTSEEVYAILTQVCGKVRANRNLFLNAVYLCETVKDGEVHELMPILKVYSQIKEEPIRAMIAQNNPYIDAALGLNGTWVQKTNQDAYKYKIENGDIEYGRDSYHYSTYHDFSIKWSGLNDYTLYLDYRDYSSGEEYEAISNYTGVLDNEITIIDEDGKADTYIREA